MSKAEFLRDPNTGVLYAYRNGKLVGPIVTMADRETVPKEPSMNLWEKKHGK